jgi:hypothetical protein
MVLKFFSALKAIGEDFLAGKAFWIPVVLALVPCVLLATKFRSNLPQLVVRAEFSHQEFAVGGGPFTVRDEFLRDLKTRVQGVLLSNMGAPFVGWTGAAATGSVDEATLLSGGSKVRFRVKVRVTNFGTVPSSVSFVSCELMESIGSHTFPIAFRTWPESKVPLPPGQETVLGNPAGEMVEFDVFDGSLSDFQTIELLGRAIRGHYPNESSDHRFRLLASYLRVLASNDFAKQDRLVSMADPEKQARVFVVVQVHDIYGRSGAAESNIIDSGAWK